MNNIIQSDLYRIRKGAAMRNTLLALLACIVLVALAFLATASVSQSALVISVGNDLDNGGISEDARSGIEDDAASINQLAADLLPLDGTSFVGTMLAENLLAMLLLVIAVAVMGADFGAGTFRNTLSYETDRKKVYLGKLAVNLILLLVLMAANVLFSGIIGGAFFGFDGFSGEFFVTSLAVLALQLPIYMALLSFVQCVLAFTRKSSAAIAVYMLFVFFYSSIVQLVSMLLPSMRWILRLDFISAIKTVAQYQTAPADAIIVPLILSFCVLAGTAALGMARYCKADMP